MAADEAGVVDGRGHRSLDAADVGDDTGGLGERPLDLVGDGLHGHGDERDLGPGVEPDGVDAPPRAGPRRAAAGSTSSPVTCQPAARRASAIEPPIRPRPITLARDAAHGLLTGARCVPAERARRGLGPTQLARGRGA